MEEINVEEYSHVYTFFGADSKVGTTMITTSIAEVLAKTNRVLVIHANKKPSVSYIKGLSSVRGIDDLQSKIESNVLDIEDINDILVKTEKFDLIAGVRELELCRKFSVEDIKEIVDLVVDKYDAILIDAGSDFEYNALAIGALNMTNNTVLVTTQQETVRREMDRTTMLSSKMKINFNEMLVNKLQPSGVAVVSVDDLQKMTGIDKIMGEIKNSPYNWQSESDYTTLSPLDKSFKKSIDEISIDISENLYINNPMPDEAKGLSRLFRK